MWVDGKLDPSPIPVPTSREKKFDLLVGLRLGLFAKRSAISKDCASVKTSLATVHALAHDHDLDHELDREADSTDAILFLPDTLILCCVHQCLFIAFKVGTCEYKVMSTPHVFPSSLLTLTLLGTG